MAGRKTRVIGPLFALRLQKCLFSDHYEEMLRASRRLSAPMINKERSGGMEVDGGSSAACYDDEKGAVMTIR